MSDQQADRPPRGNDEAARVKAREEAKLNRGRWFVAPIALIVLVGGCAALISSGRDGLTYNAAGWINCKDAVRGQLDNPATADFGITDPTMTDTSSGGVHIVGSLTAENSFGVVQELRFICDATSAGSITNAQVG